MRILIITLLLVVVTFSYAQETTTFILVRHAEKAKDGTRNPPLTSEGVERAEKLLDMFTETDITAIYSTGYTRTIKTVEPLSQKKGLEITQYQWGNPSEVAAEIYKKNKGGTVIISGHSNSTPSLANALLGEESLKQFDEADYGNLLIIVSEELGDGKLVHLRF